MCGILCSISFDTFESSEKEMLRNSLYKLKHRGPDNIEHIQKANNDNIFLDIRDYRLLI